MPTGDSAAGCPTASAPSVAGALARSASRLAARSAAALPRGSRNRPVPQRDPRFAGLGLAELRAYRHELTAEESRVSYWRRLLHARIDILNAPAGTTARELPPLLAPGHGRSLRTARLALLPAPGLPPLPDLVRLWELPDPAHPAQRTGLLAALERAEAELSAYRRALHQRLDEATAELIARYHEEPRLCLCALPALRVSSRPAGPPSEASRDHP